MNGTVGNKINLKIGNNFITVNVYETPYNTVVTVGFRLIVKHNDPLRKDCGIEKTQRFAEVLEFNSMKTYADIISFVHTNINRFLKHLEKRLKLKTASIVDEIGSSCYEFPFTEWRLEKLI